MYMRFVRIFVLAVVGLLFVAQGALATPPPPFSPYGTVKVDGANVPVGTVVSAWCDGVQYGSTTAQMQSGETWYYNLDVLGDDSETPAKDGCLPNETVRFKIGDLWADQTPPWSSSGPRLDLTATSPTPAITPTRTPTRTPTPTPIPTVTPTFTATPTPTPTSPVNSIEGIVYIDSNENGEYEPWKGEEGIPVEMNIQLWQNGELLRTRQTISGWYGFSNLTPGTTYEVHEIQPEGYSSTSPLDDVIVVEFPGGRVINQNFGEIPSTPTPTKTPTESPTVTPTRTDTPSPTPTRTITTTPVTATPTATHTPTDTPTPIQTAIAEETATQTVTPTPKARLYLPMIIGNTTSLQESPTAIPTSTPTFPMSAITVVPVSMTSQPTATLTR